MNWKLVFTDEKGGEKKFRSMTQAVNYGLTYGRGCLVVTNQRGYDEVRASFYDQLERGPILEAL